MLDQHIIFSVGFFPQCQGHLLKEGKKDYPPYVAIIDILLMYGDLL